MAGFTVDSRLFPSGTVAVRLLIVVGGELADMAAVTGGIEGVRILLPPNRRFASSMLAGEVAQPGEGGIEPLLLANVVGNRQGLETALVHGGEEVKDVLTTKGVVNLILLFFAVRAGLQYRATANVSTVVLFTDDHVFILEREFLLGEGFGIRLHSQAVHRTMPEVIETLMALAAAFGANIGGERTFDSECR